MASTMKTPVTNQTTESPSEENTDTSTWIIVGSLSFGSVFFISILAFVIVVFVRHRRARQQEVEPEHVSSSPVYISRAPVNNVSSAQPVRQVSSGQINAWSPGTDRGVSSNHFGNHSLSDYPQRPSPPPVSNFGSHPTSPISPHPPGLSPVLHSPGAVNLGYNSLDTSLLHGGARYPQYASLKSVVSPYDHPPSSKHKESDYDRLPSAKPVASDYYLLSSVSPQHSDYDHLPTSRAVSSDYDHLPLSKGHSSDYDHLPKPKAVSSGYNHLSLSKVQSSDYDHLPVPKSVYSDHDERSLISDFHHLPVPMAVSPGNEHRPLSSDYDHLPSQRRLVSKVHSSDYDTLPGAVRPVQPVQDQFKDDAHSEQPPPKPVPRRTKQISGPAFSSPFNIASNKDQKQPSGGHLRAPDHCESSVVDTDKVTNQSDDEEEPIYANF